MSVIYVRYLHAKNRLEGLSIGCLPGEYQTRPSEQVLASSIQNLRIYRHPPSPKRPLSVDSHTAHIANRYLTRTRQTRNVERAGNAAYTLTLCGMCVKVKQRKYQLHTYSITWYCVKDHGMWSLYCKQTESSTSKKSIQNKSTLSRIKEVDLKDLRRQQHRGSTRSSANIDINRSKRKRKGDQSTRSLILMNILTRTVVTPPRQIEDSDCVQR